MRNCELIQCGAWFAATVSFKAVTDRPVFVHDLLIRTLKRHRRKKRRERAIERESQVFAQSTSNGDSWQQLNDERSYSRHLGVFETARQERFVFGRHGYARVDREYCWTKREKFHVLAVLKVHLVEHSVENTDGKMKRFVLQMILLGDLEDPVHQKRSHVR